MGSMSSFATSDRAKRILVSKLVDPLGKAYLKREQKYINEL